MADPVSLILASASPRRQAFLLEAGVQFEVHVADIDESQQAQELPRAFVARLAQQKAQAVRAFHTDAAILAADTIVCCDNAVFGKPSDQAEAMTMWRRLSGREHEVMSAVCLDYQDQQHTEVVTTKVVFDGLSERAMQAYWHSGEPLDKAGAYAIQGLASAWVKEIHGSYSNVVGLPLYETNQLLSRIGLNWL